MKQPWKEQHWREQVGSILEGDQYILDEAELRGALFLEGVALDVGAVLNIKGKKGKAFPD